MNLTPKTIYWENLFRIRFWWFSLGGAVFISTLVAVVLPPLGIFLVSVLPFALGIFWLRQQMACRYCGRLLAAAKVSGPILKCPSCHELTDLALRSEKADSV
jgi:phage FluMu protein Com